MSQADDLLRRYLRRAIRLYGPRHRQDYLIAPVIFGGSCFAETIVDDLSHTITVRVTVTPEENRIQSSYQLAHEAVHCLIASGRRETIWFEEGMAVHFALTESGLPSNYLEAAKSALEDIFRNPFEAFKELGAGSGAVKKFRERYGDVDKIVPSHIKEHFSTSDCLAEKLCRRMPLAR